MSDKERKLGVVEAISVVRDQCPSGAVRRVAEQALEDIKSRRSGALREQAFNVLSAIKGWRSDRATLVHVSLKEFLEQDAARKP